MPKPLLRERSWLDSLSLQCVCVYAQGVIGVSLGLSSFCPPVYRYSVKEAGFSGCQLQQTERNRTHFKQIPGTSQHALNPQFPGFGSRGFEAPRKCAGVRGCTTGDRPAQIKEALSLLMHSSLLTQFPENEASLPGGRVLLSHSLFPRPPFPPSHILLWIAYLIERVWTQVSENP